MEQHRMSTPMNVVTHPRWYYYTALVIFVVSHSVTAAFLSSRSHSIIQYSTRRSYHHNHHHHHRTIPKYTDSVSRVGFTSISSSISSSRTSTFVHTPTLLHRRIQSSNLFAFRSADTGTTGTSNPSSSSSSATNSNNNTDTDQNDFAGDGTVSLPTTTTTSTTGSKLRRLKDMMWIRETLEDLTAAEFACTVETGLTTTTMTDSTTPSNNSNPSKLMVVAATTTTTTTKNSKSSFTRPRKRAVDYEKLLRQLNQRLRDLGCSDISNNIDTTDDNDKQNNTGIQYTLEPGVGMGTLTYTEPQRNVLLDRIVRTRTQLIEIIHGNQIEMSDTESIPSFLQKNLPSLPRMEIPKEDVGEDVLSPKLYVRDDGTVDWDGALTSGAALRKFGTAVWARINGRETDSMDDPSSSDDDDDDINHHHSNSSAIAIMKNNNNSNNNTLQLHGTSSKPVTAKIVETKEIIAARESLYALRDQLSTMERDHYKLLNSVISQGQATANVKLATLAPKIRGEIQASAVALENMKVRVSFQTLLYELERIYTYLMGELGNPSLNGYIPLQDRLNVAEFGLLESQVDTFNRQFMENDTVDEDVLAVVFEQLTDFKRRLGIDYYVAGLSFDREAIGTWLGDLWVKTKKGLAFYVKGVRLFWNDLVFCLRLINRAAQGYTLKPREVRTIRYVFVQSRMTRYVFLADFTPHQPTISFFSFISLKADV